MSGLFLRCPIQEQPVVPALRMRCLCPYCVQVSVGVFGKPSRVNEVLTTGRGKLLCLDGRETTYELISLLESVRLNLHVTAGAKKVPFRHTPALVELISLKSIFKAAHLYKGVLSLSLALFK